MNAAVAEDTRDKKKPFDEQKYYVASQWQLMWRKFRKHKLAIIGGSVLLVFYFFAIFCGFFSTQDIGKHNLQHIYAPPQKVHFFTEEGLHFPFVYGLESRVDSVTLRKTYVEDRTEIHTIHFFHRGDRYKFWGLFWTEIHFLGVETGTLFLMGTDHLGRDLFSRNLYASRISLSIGLVGVGLSFVLGCLLGGVSGYFGGSVDMLIQRLIEFLISIPTIPLWMGLSAALPKKWSPIGVFFGITVIFSVIGWCGLARVVRGKILELREADFAMAARIAGGSDLYIIGRHLLPSFFSYLIVHLSMAIPGMILGETALSFLGLGIREPAVSWGVLLQNAQHIRTVAFHPWLLFPGLFVVIVVLAFNFVGDGLRDAADPYKQ